MDSMMLLVVTLVNFQSARGASHHLTLMENCQTFWPHIRVRGWKQMPLVLRDNSKMFGDIWDRGWVKMGVGWYTPWWDFNFEKPKLGELFYLSCRGGHVHMGGRDNCSQGDNLGQNKYYTITFSFSRKVTFTFTFQENLSFPFYIISFKISIYL